MPKGWAWAWSVGYAIILFALLVVGYDLGRVHPHSGSQSLGRPTGNPMVNIQPDGSSIDDFSTPHADQRPSAASPSPNDSSEEPADNSAAGGIYN